MSLFISYLRHPAVAFDMYVHEIVMRLIGTLFSSYSWLHMKKLDKMIEAVSNSLSNNNNNGSAGGGNNGLGNQIALVDSLTNSLRWLPLSNSQAELATGLTYSYAFTFNNSQTKSSADTMFVHCMRMLCLLAAVIDESALPSVLTANLTAGSTAVSAPPPPSAPTTSTASSSTLAPTSTSTSNSSSAPSLVQTTTSQSNTDTSPSFIRSKLNNIAELRQPKTSGTSSSSLSSATANKTNPSSESTSTTATNEGAPSSSSLPKTTTNVYLGYFQASSHYLKLYETSKLAYNTYKKSAQIGSYDRFTSLLKQTLHVFAQLLESALSVHEVGPHLDEILLYLRIIFAVEPSCTVKCVTLCLKSLFGLNLAGLMFEYVQQQLVKFTSGSAASTPALSPSNASLSSYPTGNSILPMSTPLSSKIN